MAQYAASVIDKRPAAIRDVTLRLHRALLPRELWSVMEHAMVAMVHYIAPLQISVLSPERTTPTIGHVVNTAREQLRDLLVRLK